MMRLLLVSATLLLLSACASLPDSIHVEQPDQLPPYAEVKADPARYQGQTLIAGGLIVSVRNEADHSVLEVLQLPLNRSGRPAADSHRSQGRFRVTFTELLDPEIYSNGKAITVRAQVSGYEDDRIGQHPYRYLTLLGNGYYLWPEQPDEVQVRYYMGLHTYTPYPVYVQPPRPPLKP